VQIAENVSLSPALRTGTGAPQLFQRDKAFGAVIPLDSQLTANELKINGSHQAFFVLAVSTGLGAGNL
jgi:hypothetical protein